MGQMDEAEPMQIRQHLINEWAGKLNGKASASDTRVRGDQVVEPGAGFLGAVLRGSHDSTIQKWQIII